MSSKKCPECKKGAPRWMVTFGDMMALLLTFFVLLLSFAQLDIVKFEEVAGSLKDAFGIQRIEQVKQEPSGNDMMNETFNSELVLIHLMEKIHFVLRELIDNGEAEVLEMDEGFLIRLNSDGMFSKNSAHLHPDVRPRLTDIANHLKKGRNLIRVVGHTDSTPADPQSAFPNNWALSSAHAAAVTQFLITAADISPERFEARGRAEYSSVASNTTPQGRVKNRRVEILISRETLAAPRQKSVAKIEKIFEDE
ncbi:flagellar motor protein MotB [Magnetococcales bacterium HHB-1]